ncbi:MAG: hypothetical protein D6815_03560 [Candidatus Dadabacteria bacterium]|nr:MAG: hypothetical protein D6815_03560 [Candidatus Dadabacteria bacterium]
MGELRPTAARRDASADLADQGAAAWKRILPERREGVAWGWGYINLERLRRNRDGFGPGRQRVRSTAYFSPETNGRCATGGVLSERAQVAVRAAGCCGRPPVPLVLMHLASM